MNTNHILSQLQEMHMHLGDLIKDLETGEIGDEDWPSLAVDMGHILDHFCYAWNGRNLRTEDLPPKDQAIFEKMSDGVPNFGFNQFLVDDAI